MGTTTFPWEGLAVVFLFLICVALVVRIWNLQKSSGQEQSRRSPLDAFANAPNTVDQKMQQQAHKSMVKKVWLYLIFGTIFVFFLARYLSS